MKRPSYDELDPELVIEDGPRLAEHHRKDVEPPYTEDDLRKIEMFKYLWHEFLQNNGLTTRKLVNESSDSNKVVLRVKDLTPEGFEFYSRASRFLDLSDFNVNPENRVERILEKELAKLRLK